MPAETCLAISSLIFGGVLERLPRLRIAFAHGGGSFPATVGRISHGFHARPDLCAVDNAVDPMEYLKRIYVDSLVHHPAALRYMLDSWAPNASRWAPITPSRWAKTRPGELIESLGLDR